MSNLTQAERLFSQENAFAPTSPQRYHYSFSGADARMLAYFPSHPELIAPLESVNTISISVHEGKSQVRALGYRGIKGLTRSVRTIAGSLILTIVNDHPLRPLIQQYELLTDITQAPYGWSVDRDETGVGTWGNQFSFENRLTSLLPPFNIMMEFVAESAPVITDVTGKSSVWAPRKLFPGAGLLLQGIEIIDEGIIVSVNDMVSEITCSFIARDYKPFSAQTFSDSHGQGISLNEISSREYDLWKRMNPPGSHPAGQVLVPNGHAFDDHVEQNIITPEAQDFLDQNGAI